MLEKCSSHESHPHCVLKSHGWLAQLAFCETFFTPTGLDVKDHHEGQLVALIEYQKHLSQWSSIIYTYRKIPDLVL
jgi:hypothetical protein